MGHLIHESSFPVRTPLARHFQNKLMMAQQVKNLLEVQETQEIWVQSLGQEKEWQPTPVFLPGKFRGQRNLAGYSPQGRRESDTTE